MTYRLPKVSRISDHTFFDHLLCRNEAVIVDLGMNNGDFSRQVRGLHPNVTIFGCEPVPSLHKKLSAEFGSSALNLAVAGKTEDGQITLYDDYCPSMVLDGLGECSNGAVPTQVVSLDDLVDRLKIKHIDLLRVDIEGSELAMILNASAGTLGRCDQITVEFHDWLDPGHLPGIRSCILRLQTSGFEVFRCSISSYSDVLFVRKRFIRSIAAKAIMWAAIAFKTVNYTKARNFLGRTFRTRAGRATGATAHT